MPDLRKVSGREAVKALESSDSGKLGNAAVTLSWSGKQPEAKQVAWCLCIANSKSVR